jgi:hypothetical protein
VEPQEDNIFEWKCIIKADVSLEPFFQDDTLSHFEFKSDSPYKGGKFKFNLTLPSNYPFQAPTVITGFASYGSANLHGYLIRIA